MSPLKGKDFNTTAIDYRFSDLDYKLLKKDYKTGHRKAFSSSNKLVMHSETLAEGPRESTGWKAFNKTAIYCRIQ
jgi:hypothetical protein